MQYAGYQLKWLTKRILPVFGSAQTNFPKLLMRIELNDASLYEQVALVKAEAFISVMLAFFKGLHDTDYFLQNFCSHHSELKRNKLLGWKKTTCEFCSDGSKSLELNGEHEWLKHIKTRKHKSMVAKHKKQATGLSDREYYQAIKPV
jgi:hypothetical protein